MSDRIGLSTSDRNAAHRSRVSDGSLCDKSKGEVTSSVREKKLKNMWRIVWSLPLAKARYFIWFPDSVSPDADAEVLSADVVVTAARSLGVAKPVYGEGGPSPVYGGAVQCLRRHRVLVT